MSRAQSILGPILNPRADGTVEFIHDGMVSCDEAGIIRYVGPAAACPLQLASSRRSRSASGMITPPFLDAHTHIPQWPIRGHFMKGIEPNAPGGRLIAGLDRNVFPVEARCADEALARECVRQFLQDTMSKGVVGGAAYMTVHSAATRIALEMLPDTWQVGLVLMNQNCPLYLRTDEPRLETDVRELARDFGSRFILTDRFAVAVDSQLRQRAADLAAKLGLRMQTHLNEQTAEKRFVEDVLYPEARSYTDVYARDGLLARDPILAHCIHMHDSELEQVSKNPGAAVAHCPSSNTLLGSGTMPLDPILSAGIDYAICTDVGAAPTTSLLAEMHQFLVVHRHRSSHATPQQALFRATLAPARILRMDSRLGRLEVGKPMSFVEISADVGRLAGRSADDAILGGLLDTSVEQLDTLVNDAACRHALEMLAGGGLEIGPVLDCLTREVAAVAARLEPKVMRVTIAARELWRRNNASSGGRDTS